MGHVVIAGDLHMGLKDLGHRTGDSVESFYEVLKVAHQLGVNTGTSVPVVLAGDVWDSVNVHPTVLKMAINRRNLFPDVKIYYIDGNHDHLPEGETSWTNFLGEVLTLSMRPVEVSKGIRVAGIPWQQPSEFEKSIKTFKNLITDEILENRANVLVVHQFIEAAENSMIRSSIPVSLFSDLKFPVIAGDIHKEITVGDNVVYTGATNRRTIVEPSGSCIIVSTEQELGHINLRMPEYVMSAGQLHVFRYHLPYRPMRIERFAGRFELDNVQDVSFYNGELKPYIVIQADSFEPEAVRELNARAEGKAYLIYRRLNNEPVEEEESSDEKLVLDGSKDYARKAIKDYTASHGAKELALEMLEDEERFFSDLKDNFDL